MKHKTRGIVINYIKFRETSIISRIYTDEFGLKSYILNGIRSSKPRIPISLFQPLTQVDMIVYNKMHASLNRVAEIKCYHPYHSIPYEIVKSSVALFITEIFFKIMKDEEINPDLYAFIEGSLNFYDRSDSYYMNFHLQFLLKLTRYFGIFPESASDMIRETASIAKEYSIGEQDRHLLNDLLKKRYEEPVRINNRSRETILRLIIMYYQAHFDHLSEIKSYKVLKEVFGN